MTVLGEDIYQISFLEETNYILIGNVSAANIYMGFLFLDT